MWRQGRPKRNRLSSKMSSLAIPALLQTCRGHWAPLSEQPFSCAKSSRHTCWEHMRIDLVHSSSPPSKTDPTAVGCKQSMGCCTGIGDDVPPDSVFHAVATNTVCAHCAGHPVGGPSRPRIALFPDVSGNMLVTKAAIVAMIEHASQSAGIRLFGGHSLPVSGSQWLGILCFGVEKIWMIRLVGQRNGRCTHLRLGSHTPPARPREWRTGVSCVSDFFCQRAPSADGVLDVRNWNCQRTAEED